MNTEEHQEAEERGDEAEVDKIDLSELICISRKRANNLKISAIASLALIFITLCSCIYIFVYAIQLTEIITFESYQEGTVKEHRGEQLDKREQAPNYFAKDKIIEQSLTADQQFISMVLNKIGALLILFFAVKLLINLYRYNIVLSGYYDSRADILQMVNNYDLQQIDALGEFITPEKIDFGTTPSLPTEQAITLVKEITSGLKK